MAFTIVSVKLACGETALCGVTLEPYVILKKSDGSQITADETFEEGTSDGTYQLRSRWYRGTINRGASYCSIHHDREATVQCLICLRGKCPAHLSFHCTPDCLKSHWSLHKDYHRQVHTNGNDNGYDMSYSNRSNSIYSNGEQWIEVAKSRLYTPTQEDQGFTLKYECSVVDIRHPLADCGRQHIITLSRVRPAPNPPMRNMLPIPPGPNVMTKANGKFTILTYNVLAELYATAEQFPYCASWALAWHFRKINLLKEILNYNPDILCLQEVQSDHMVDFFLPKLREHGYTAIYKKKTKEMYTGSGHTIDGCATFFRDSKFALVKKYEVEFNKAAASLAETFDNPTKKSQAMNRLMKDNVALIAVLEALELPSADQRRQLICVANTHIHANKDMNDVKLWQVHTLLKGLEKIAASADIPMLVAGDFNSLPGSAAHQLLSTGSVQQPLVEKIDPLKLVLDNQKLQHQLPLASAYAKLAEVVSSNPAVQKQKARVDPVHKEPTFTNLSKEFRGTLDYILYTRDSLVPVGLLEIPAESELLPKGNDEGLPNSIWSSDHVALMAEFQYLRT